MLLESRPHSGSFSADGGFLTCYASAAYPSAHFQFCFSGATSTLPASFLLINQMSEIPPEKLTLTCFLAHLGQGNPVGCVFAIRRYQIINTAPFLRSCTFYLSQSTVEGNSLYKKTAYEERTNVSHLFH